MCSFTPGVDKHYQIANWVYQQGDFISINEIAKQFGLSRATLYRQIDKITNSKEQIVTQERFYKTNNQWQRQLRVCMLSYAEGCNSVKMFFNSSCIWSQLISKKWSDIYIEVEL